jgi:hypothetical protein
MESGEPLSLHSGPAILDGAPPQLSLPSNLFIIGTVNADETTYAFSPKVLDRANVIEFRVSREAMADFLNRPEDDVKLDALAEQGKIFGKALVHASNREIPQDDAARRAVRAELQLIFDALAAHNAEFGFRVAHEVARFTALYGQLDTQDGWLNRAMDAQVVQKILPKLNGARGRLGPALWALALLCRQDRPDLDEMIRQSREQSGDDPAMAWSSGAPMRYPISAEKIARMWTTLNQNGFVSFLDA